MRAVTLLLLLAGCASAPPHLPERTGGICGCVDDTGRRYVFEYDRERFGRTLVDRAQEQAARDAAKLERADEQAARDAERLAGGK